MKIKAEQIMDDAEVAAIFFRALCEKGVAVSAAVALTSSYLMSVVNQRAYHEKPREPWEGDAP